MIHRSDGRDGQLVLLAQLEAVVAVARGGSMRAAGGVLRLSQPALSARISGLEQELGVRLFDRGRLGMTLTPAGESFLAHAERALAAVDAGSRIAREVADGQDGALVVAAAPAVSAYVVPELIARLRRVYLGVHVSVRTGHSEEVVELVASGDAHVGLVRDLHDSRLRFEPLYEERLILVARPDHPFVYEGKVALERMRDATLVLFDRTSSYYELTHALFRDAAVAPYGVIEVDNIETARRMVERGLGVALLPTTATADGLSSGTLAAIELAGVHPIRRRIAAVEQPGRGDWAPITALWILLRAIPTFVVGTTPIASVPGRR